MSAVAAEVTDIALRPVEAPGELTIEQIVAQTLKVQQCIAAVMKDGEHYGVIPGTTQEGKPPKKVLLKPGAEKLCLMFRLDPEYDTVTAIETPSLIRFVIRCTLFHIPTQTRIASGLGSCNSNEDKYMRAAPKKCPSCGKTSIIKGSPQYGGGYVCWKKKDGCGAKYSDGAPEIEGQETGIKDPADLHNTILKMACKRALIAAVLNATAASDFFTQDLEDLTEKAAEYIPPDNLKEKLEASIKEQAPKATARAATADTPTSSAGSAATAASGSSSASVEERKYGKRFPKANAGVTAAATAASPAATETTSAATAPTGTTPSIPLAPGDTGEPATIGQKEAIRGHIRKKGWKRGFVKLWFAELFGINSEDPLEALSQTQADVAHFLVMAHGTANYRKVRMEYADQGLCRKDENDIQF